MTERDESIGLRHGTLAIAPHDPAWAELYEAEARRIRSALPGTALEIDHVGSTAVVGLPAKPILDVAVRAAPEDESAVASALVGLGYVDRGVRGGRLFVRVRGEDVRTHNLHLYPPGDSDCRDQIAFRDALRRDRRLRDRYAALKHRLAASLAGRRKEYAGSKTAFVRETLEASVAARDAALRTALGTCEAVARERYPGSALVLLAGSVARDEATPTSDLDLVVVFDRLRAARRESFEADGWPVEAFVHDPETIAWFVTETDRRSGTPSLATMIAEGIPVAGSDSLREDLKAFAAAEIERGPAAWTPEDVESSRYLITDLLTDLEGGGSRAELTATGVELHRALARHVFGTRRLWVPKRKRLPRELERLSGELAARFRGAFDELFGRGDPAAAIGLGDAMLDEHGGRRFAGFSRRAPIEWRRPFPRGRR